MADRRQQADRVLETLLEVPDLEWDAFVREHVSDPGTRELVLTRLREAREAARDSGGTSSENELETEVSIPVTRSGEREVTDFGDYVRDEAEVSEHSSDLEVDEALPTPVEARRRIGPYLLVETLGHGGMGTVYRAVQSEPIEREVAIKVIRPSMLSDQTRHRFESERRAVALMSHPAIAQVFEAGDTADGEPYFVMELVLGEPITEYCDRLRLSIEDRLKLFVTVCQGVQHAHQKGILHRDLKPANILVSEDEERRPSPKIIDFGVAKMLEHGDASLTAHGVVVGTPSYISPEALQGIAEGIDTRTDVYSLGVLLYELLTGVRPFGSDSDSILKVFQRIAREDVKAPSRRWCELPERWRRKLARNRGLQPRALARRLTGDLDWIALMATTRNREERYSSAAELATDVERHLRFEPVLAGPPTLGYRLGKFVRRHRGSVAAAVLVVAALVGGIVARTTEARRASEAAAAAQRAATEAEEVASFLVDLFQVSDPGRSLGNTVTARELLDRGVDGIHGRLEGQPLTRARLLDTMGKVYERLGLHAEARGLLEESLALQEEALPAGSPEIALAVQRLGHLEWLEGAYPEAQVTLERARELLEAALGPEDPEVASVLDDLGSVYNVRGKYDLAEPTLRRALAIREAHYGPDSLPVAASLDDLAVFYIDQNRPEEALPLAERAHRILETERGPSHPGVASNCNTRSIAYFLVDRPEEGLALAEEALEIRRRVLPANHPDLGQSLNNVGEAYLQLGRLDDAEALLEEARENWERALGSDHRRVGLVILNLGDLAHARGDLETAERDYLESLAVLERALGSEHPHLAYVLQGLGEVYAETGRASQARETLSRALAIAATGQPEGSEMLDELRSALRALA